MYYILEIYNNTSIVVLANGNNQYTVTLNVPTGYTYSENVTNVIISKRIYGLYN